MKIAGGIVALIAVVIAVLAFSGVWEDLLNLFTGGGTLFTNIIVIVIVIVAIVVVLLGGGSGKSDKK